MAREKKNMDTGKDKEPVIGESTTPEEVKPTAVPEEEVKTSLPEEAAPAEGKPDVTAQEEAVNVDSLEGDSGGEKEEKTVMLESDGTVLKEIVPGSLDVPEKKGTIHVLTGSESGKKYDITGSPGVEARVGRDEINDIIVKGDGVSRYHAKFIIEDSGKVKIVDLDSKNGTFVNGKKIKEQVLSGGEKVFFGDVACKFEGLKGAGLDKKPLFIAAGAVVGFLLFLTILIKLFSGGKEAEKPQAVQPVQQRPVAAVSTHTKEKAVKKTGQDRLKQKIAIAEREFEFENYDDALQIIDSVLEKDEDFAPAIKLKKKITSKKQQSLDKEILKLAKKKFEDNSFDDAKDQLLKIGKTSTYYKQAQQYIEKIDKLPEAEKRYKKALIFWKEGNIDGTIEALDESLAIIAVYKKPAMMKKDAKEMKGLLDRLDTAETNGQIKEIENLCKQIQEKAKSSKNAFYKIAQGKISKIEFGKNYKANKFYMIGMRQLSEERYRSAIENLDKARQLLPQRKSYDIRYKETVQKVSKQTEKLFYAAYVLAEKDPGRSKKVLQKILKLDMENDPFYKKAVNFQGQ